MCLSCRKIWTALHIFWSVVYVCLGAVQIITGIFLVISIPEIRLSSNIWAGSWNVLIGIISGMLACFGKQTHWRQEVLLYLTFSILVMNLVNCIINEFHFFISDNLLEEGLQDNTFNQFIFYARICTRISGVAVLIAAFLDSQLTYCSMQTKDWEIPYSKKDGRAHHEQIVSDIEYIIPRPKSSSTPKNTKVYNAYAQSWVFDSTATTDKLHEILEPETTTLDQMAPPTVHIDSASDSISSSTNHIKCSTFSQTPSPLVLSLNSSQISLSAPGPKSPRSPGDVQYASLMQELQNKLKKSDSSDSEEFSKELEAALQLIHDLDTPSETGELQTFKGKTSSQSTSGYSSPSRCHSTFSIYQTETSAIISLHPTQPKRKSVSIVHIVPEPKPVIAKAQTIDRRVSAEPAPVERAQTIDRSMRVSESLWNVKSLLRKNRRSKVPELPPELEGAIFKSESLAYLNDEQLLERYQRNVELQRSIEQRIHQQLGHSSESHC